MQWYFTIDKLFKKTPVIDTVESFGSIQEAYKNRSGIQLIIFNSLPESMDTHVRSMVLLETKLVIRSIQETFNVSNCINVSN